jgi:hypothetical protein
VVQENFTALPITAHITGSVHDGVGNPLSGLQLYAFSATGNYESLNQATDNLGNYSLGVASGSWSINFSLGGEDGLDSLGYEDISGPHLVSVPPTNAVMNLTVYPIGTPLISNPHRLSASQFGFDIKGANNVSYTVQVSTNLNSTNWSPLFSLVLTNSPFPVVDLNATNSPRFYRIKKN